MSAVACGGSAETIIRSQIMNDIPRLRLRLTSAGPSGWAIKSNYPALDSGRVFRLDWFDLFLNFITLMLVVVALFTKVIFQVRLIYFCIERYMP